MVNHKGSRSILTTFTNLVPYGLLLLAFLFRWKHLLARIFHVDEFISMLAMQMTAQKGAPILPSGVLYSQGLLLSYVAVPFVRVSEVLSEEMMRWPSLLAGMLAAALFYTCGRRLFDSRVAGLAALALAAMDNQTVVWSARARMYSLAGLFVLLAIYLLLRGTLDRKPSFALRLAAAVCFLAAVTSHAVAVVLLPPLFLALALVVWLGRDVVSWPALRSPAVWLQVLLIGALLLLALGFGVAGQLPFLSPASAGGGGEAGDGGVLQVLDKFLQPGLGWERVDDYVYRYTSPQTWPLTALAGVALALGLAAAFRHRLTRRDLVTLFLGLLFLITLAQVSLLLPSTWRKSRYLFILCQAPLVLLAADGIARLAHLLLVAFERRGAAWSAVTGLLVVAFLVLCQRASFPAFLGPHGAGGYDTALLWLKEQIGPDDRVMTVHPSAGFLYLGRGDYYAAQSQARVVADDESDELVDRYVGSQLVETVDGLNAILAEQGKHLWFVVDNVRLFKRYEPYFSQQVFAQMDRIHETGGVSVFRGQAFPRPVPAEPAQSLDVDFGGLIRLEGFGFDPADVAPDGSMQLVLFWRLQTEPVNRPYKVFVQLRDEGDRTVAQADHFIWNGLLTNAALGEMGRLDDWLRDSVLVPVPPDLPAGRYRLLVGLYDPETLDRLPLVDDHSGENAVLLKEMVLP